MINWVEENFFFTWIVCQQFLLLGSFVIFFCSFSFEYKYKSLKRCCWKAVFHNNETQLSLFETSHYPFLPRLLLLCISRLNGFILSLYLEFSICSIQSLSTWEQFKVILLKKMFHGLFRCTKYWAISEFFKLWSIGKPQSTPNRTSFSFPFFFLLPLPSLQYSDCCIYQGVPNQGELFKTYYITNLKKILNNHCYTFPRQI